MDTNESVGKNELDEAVAGESITGGADKVDDVELLTDISIPSALANDTITLHAYADSYWAKLTVEYWWAPNGKTFTGKTLRYSAKDNGNENGNVHFGVYSAEDNGGNELITNAIQDGGYHTLVRELSVKGNTDYADIGFGYEYDLSLADDPYFEDTERVYFVPRAPGINPIRNVTDRTFTVTGTNGVSDGGSISIYNTSGDKIGAAVIETNGNWTASVTMSVDEITLYFYANQRIGNKYSVKSDNVQVYLLAITSPAANAVLPSDGLIFKGTGFPGTRILIVDAIEHRTNYTENTYVKSDGKWEAPLSKNVSGSMNVQAQYQFGAESIGYSSALSFTILNMLVITPPTTDHEMEFTVYGTNGTAGAKVEAKIDLGDIKVGEGNVAAGGAWSALVRMPPGSTSLVAEQIYQNVRSQRSVAEAFRIKPPKLVNVGVSYPSPATVRFSGAGYNGATVEIFIAYGSVQVSTEVINETWSVDWTDQPPSKRQMNARQSVPDGTGGWINSAWHGPFNIDVPVPVPYLTYQVDLDRIPVFSGTGHDWPDQPAARIEVRREGVSTPAVPIVEVKNRAWSSAATEAWDPGTYRVQAWQLFKTAQDPEVRSAPTELVIFDIKAPLPTVEFTHDGLTPHFFGTCLNNARVTVWFDGDEGNSQNAQVTGKNWVFTRLQPFMPGAYVVYVTQTLGGQTSSEISRPFNVAVLQPVITSPIDIDVDHNPVIKGTGGVSGAVMSVFDYVMEKPLGQASVSGDEWSVHLEDRPFGLHTVYAVQKYGELLSVKSTTVSFKVILLAPIIDHPQPGDVIPRLSRIDGYARKALGFETARVQLWLEGADAPLAEVTARGRDGYWWYSTPLPLGVNSLRVKQIFDGEESAFSPAHDFTVVPPKPVIESPALLQRMGSTVTISGHGYVADWVEVAWSDAPETVLGSTQVQENRTWSLQLHVDRPAGVHKLVAQQECDGYRSGWSEEHSILLLSRPPTFTAPVAGQWSERRPLFEGRGDNGKTIELSHWFDSRQLVTQGHPVAGDTWTAHPDALLVPGPHWMKARQVGEDGSDWGDSLRFEVVPTEGESDVSH